MVEFYGISTSHSGVLVHGDNLEVLIKLKQTFTGKVKCIYIDPPYNTSSFFCDFNDSLDENEWLNMMEPRLLLLWDLLSEDGSLWISIDDNECHYLKVLCDRIFGRMHFLGTIVREKNDAPRNLKHRIPHMHDYLLVYSKNPDSCMINDIPFEMFLRYAQKDADNCDWIPLNLIQKARYGEGNKEPVEINGEPYTPSFGFEWTMDSMRIRELAKGGRIDIKEDLPTLRRYKSDWNGLPPTSIWLKEWVGSNQEARHEICQLFHNEFFYVPKPERLLSTIIEVASRPGDIVLDAFLGTGTTVAVAHKMNRKWIGIEIGTQCEQYCLPRLKEVIEGEQGGISRKIEWKGGGRFAYISNVVDLDPEECKRLLLEMN